MPTSKFRCNRCKRSFKMAAHLARHNNTIHATKKAKSAVLSARTFWSFVREFSPPPPARIQIQAWAD